METESRAHKKIRFRRDEIVNLAALPSAAEPALQAVPQKKPRRRRPFHRAGMLFAGFAALFCAILFFVAIFGLPAIGTERLREQAERAASRFAGEPIAASLGRLGISFDSARLLALEVSDVSMAAENPGGPQISAGEVRFGLQLWPLLEGRIQLGRASLVDARIVAGALQQNGERDWAAGLKNEQGLIDPDKVLAAIFNGLHRAFNGLDAGSTSTLGLENVEIVLPGQDKTTTFVIRSASLQRTAQGLAIAADLNINGRSVAIEGNAARSDPAGPIADLTLALDSDPIDRDDPVIDDGAATVDPSLGALEVDIAGREGMQDDRSRLTVSASMTQAAIDLGQNGIIAGSAELRTELLSGTGKLEFKRLALTTGGTTLDFHGALGPRPAVETAAGAPGAYRFELVSDGSQLAAEGLQEPSLGITARLTGTYAPDASLLDVDELRLNTQSGQLVGKGEMQFDGRRAPGIHAQILTSAMPVASAKQIWPFVVAPGARSWVLKNVFGGQITESEINIGFDAGRLGDGHPFNAQEVNGRFVVEDTRFDLVGQLPPVRDAAGVITFGGNDAFIALSKGTAYLSDNRAIAISNGTFNIPGNQPNGPAGDLTLDLAGEAVAVGELAALEPINALRFIGVEADDLSGEIWGTVRAHIPLSLHAKKEDVRWAVDLAYDKLAMAKPFSGQMVSEASGTATIDPKQALIVAKAKLNGIPADIDLVEPINPADAAARKRQIRLNLDDASRREHFPALDELVSGPMTLHVDAASAERQTVKADLKGTEIRLPWVGWSKGAGVPAALSFSLSAKENATDLSDFELSGESFAVAGDVRLDKGGLASAKLGTVRLNRGDKASLDLERKGKSYAIRIRGSQFDARALVKKYLADSAATAGREADTISVSLDAALESATGFFNERVSNLTATYESGTGALRITGVLDSGGAVGVQTDDSGGTSSVRVQSTDAGGMLRFVDLYEYMRGGRLELALAGPTGRALVGTVDARDFEIVDEPKLRSLVSSAPSEGQSLNDRFDGGIDVSRAVFERGYTRIEKSPGLLRLSEGVVRGPAIGASFQGTFYDPNGNMDMTGTFLPAYGVNRIFGEIPLIGQILGNGRDRALIGITFRLVGDAKKPDLQINPISAIAPGIFRSIFEF